MAAPLAPLPRLSSLATSTAWRSGSLEKTWSSRSSLPANDSASILVDTVFVNPALADPALADPALADPVLADPALIPCC